VSANAITRPCHSCAHPLNCGADAGAPGRFSREGRARHPPPQPIFMPETNECVAEPNGTPPGTSPPGSPSGAPKRSKSLMQRIRTMRDNPNVPAGDAYYDAGDAGDEPAGAGPSVARPTHRTQRSFIGGSGAGGGARRRDGPSSPDDDAVVYVEKDLPTRPARVRPRPRRCPSSRTSTRATTACPARPRAAAGSAARRA
jgi:hypothetical protein